MTRRTRLDVETAVRVKFNSHGVHEMLHLLSDEDLEQVEKETESPDEPIRGNPATVPWWKLFAQNLDRGVR